MSTPTPNPFSVLQGADFMVLTTYRTTGNPVVTTVWFAQEGDTLYVSTGAQAGKVKRIRHTPRVMVAPSDRMGNTRGPAVAAVARVLPADEASVADTALDRKYGIQRKIITGGMRLRGSQSVFLELTAAPSDSPDATVE